jgi:hypothetical protein
VDEVQDRVWWREGPSDLMTQPVERDELASAVLPHDLEVHGADEGHPTADGRAAKGIPGNDKESFVSH